MLQRILLRPTSRLHTLLLQAPRQHVVCSVTSLCLKTLLLTIQVKTAHEYKLKDPAKQISHRRSHLRDFRWTFVLSQVAYLEAASPVLRIYGYFAYSPKGICTWSAIKAGGEPRRWIVPLRGRLTLSAPLMGWREETSAHLTGQKHAAKKGGERRGKVHQTRACVKQQM